MKTPRVSVQGANAWAVAVVASTLVVPTLTVGASSEKGVTLQKFEVTGTNIKSVDVEGSSSLVTLDQEQIERSGALTTSELFRDVIFNAAGAIDETFTQGFAPASAAVDLRGLGVNRTLVLVDGRRVPFFPFAQDASATFVDLNLIPLGSIERVEILKDGASAVYGSDAIAGVVNIITRQDYDGGDLRVSLSGNDENDGEQGRLSLTGGLTQERSNITFNLEYLDRTEVRAKDRDLSKSANSSIDDRSRAGDPGTIIRLSDGSLQPDPRCPADSINPEKGPFCLYDFAPSNTLIPETQRLGLVTSGSFDLTESVTFFGSGSYTDSETERDLAAPPPNDPFFVGADNPNNIFPGEDVLVIYRTTELGSRTNKFETDAWNLLGGVRGYVSSWDWEFAVGGGKIDTKDKGRSGYATQAAVQESIDNGTLNPFGDSPDFDAQAVRYVTRRDGKSELYYTDLKTTGELLELPHGPLSVAFGTEFRKEEFSDEFDSVTESGEVIGVGGVSSKGDRDIFGAYGELSIPVLKNVEVTVAGRYDRYDDFGSTYNPQLGLRWQPLNNLLIRASAGTGFKAPSLPELYSGEIDGFDSVFDPVTGNVTQVTTISRGNEDLEEEESDNYGLGLALDITRWWDVSVDYWRIHLDDAVANDPQFYVDNEQSFPDNVVRGPSGEIVEVRNPFANVTKRELWGIDLATNLLWQTERAGDFGLNLGAAYLGSFDQKDLPDASFEELAGKDGRPRWRSQATLDWNRTQYTASVIVNYVGDYERRLEGQDDDRVNSWTSIDSQFKWEPMMLQNSTFTFGIKNVFDQDPPKDPFLEGWPFFNRSLHSARERSFYANYQHSF